MTRLSWDERGSRVYEAGVDRGVLYPRGEIGISWNGLLSVKENASGADSVEKYFDGRKYNQRRRPSEFAGTVEAITYPDELEEGEHYHFSYRTRVGNDVKGSEFGYKIHLVYNAFFTPSEKQRQSQGDSADVTPFSWDISTLPEKIPSAKPTSHLVIDTRRAYSWTVKAVEEVLYGTDAAGSRMPTPIELLEIFEAHAILRIIDHGDGTWTAIGPDDAIQMINQDEFAITWPSAVYISGDTYQISSL